MKKEFIPYELEVKLVELGFNEKTFDVHSDGWTQGFKVVKKPTPRILFQQAFRWFREKYDLQYTITWNKHYPKTPYEWEVRKSWRDEPLRPYGIGGMSATYEEAELECLKKLIEIAKE